MSSDSDAPPTLLGQTAQDAGSDTESAAPAPGTRVGRYAIIEKIGRGAMGVVYRARDPELARDVAIKLLAATHDGSSGGSAGARARMVREAQSLAALAHPNVVAVHDVGTFRDAVFVTMELIDGVTLRTWMGERKRSWREVVDVFTQAGRGLAAAHAAGFVHRDFKPENVMIERGRARVMDFGLARSVVERESTATEQLSTARESVELTGSGALMGTPAYMSPEQWAGIGVDERSDQFSFCVALYEALFGERPFGGDSLSSLAVAVTTGAMRPLPAEARVPARLRRVVMRGLAVDPNARWPKIDALLEALARASNSRARPVAIGVAAVVLCAGGVAGWIAIDRARCQDRDHELAGIWDAAQQHRIEQAIISSEIPSADDTWQRVQAGLDARADAWMHAHTQACLGDDALPSDLRPAQVLCLAQRKRELAALTVVLSEADVAITSHAVEATEALPRVDACTDAERLAMRVPPPSDPGVAQAVEEERDRLAAALAHELAARGPDAIELATASVEHAETLGYAPVLAEALLRRGRAQALVGDYPSAGASLQAAYEGALASGDDVTALDASLAMTRIVGQEQGRPDAAESWLANARALSKRAGVGAERQAEVLSRAAGIARSRGDFEAARDDLELALELIEPIEDPDAVVVARMLADLATALAALGDADASAPMFGRALAVLEEALGPDHPHVAVVLNNQGIMLRDHARLDEAATAFARAREITERAFGPDHPDLAMTLANAAGVDFFAGRTAEARAKLERALAIFEKAFGPDHPAVAQALSELAQVRLAERDVTGARRDHERALRLLEKALGPDHIAVADVHEHLGVALHAASDYARSREHHERALAIRRAVLGEEHVHVARSLMNLALVDLDSKGKTDVAQLERAVTSLERNGAPPEGVAQAHALLERAKGRPVADLQTPK